MWKKAVERYGPLPFADGLPTPKEALFSVLEELKNNAAAGSTVALVNIPLSISLGIPYIIVSLTPRHRSWSNSGTRPGDCRLEWSLLWIVWWF